MNYWELNGSVDHLSAVYDHPVPPFPWFLTVKNERNHSF